MHEKATETYIFKSKEKIQQFRHELEYDHFKIQKQIFDFEQPTNYPHISFTFTRQRSFSNQKENLDQEHNFLSE